VRCTKDTCANHLCEKCDACSDCCDCEIRLNLAVDEPAVDEPAVDEPADEVPDRMETAADREPEPDPMLN
jgi:hypothetical protein